MSIKSLILRSGSKYEIPFQSTVDLESFELLLKATYNESRQERFNHVVLSFRVVRWINPLQLSMTAQWILELKDLGKRVEVVYPTNQTVISFLDSYRFTHFLKSNEISSNREETAVNFNYVDRPFLPLSFVNSEEYKKILHELSIPKIYSALFDEESYSLVGGKGLLRDILIKELGDNMQQHGECKFGNLLVTKIRGVPEEKKDKTEKKEKVKKPVQRELIDEITDKPHVLVVISDKGKGIYKTLKNGYQQETRYKHKVDDPNGCDVISYATEEYASSRTPEERMPLLEELQSKELGDFNPFTGLFQVKEMVRKYMGILTIRSGNSFVIFNFYDKRGKLTLMRSDATRGYRSLANFGGTQVKVVLPILEDYKEIEENLYGKFNIQEANDKITYHYISIADYFSGVKTELEIRKACHLCLNEIQAKSNLAKWNSIILDCKTNQVSVDTKIKALMICYLMKCQDIYDKSHVLINCDPSLINPMNDSLENKHFSSYRPITAFNHRLARDVIGVRSEERRIFYEIQSIREFSDSRLTNFANKYRSLFAYERQTDTWSVRHNRTSVLETVILRFQDQLREIVLSPENKIFHSSIKVLSTNGIYFDKYFEIYTLFQNPDWKYLTQRWLELQIRSAKPACVISITDWVGGCIDELMSTTELTSVKNILHLNLSTPYEINRKDISGLLQMIEGERTVVVVTDVVATGNSLQNMLESYAGISITRCVCIVSLKEIQEIKSASSDESIPIVSIVHEPAKGYPSKPRAWRYDETHEVNRETHKVYVKKGIDDEAEQVRSLFESPLENYSLRKQPESVQSTEDPRYYEMVEDYINPFFENVVVPNQAFELRIIANRRYMPVFYKLPVILKNVMNEIIDDLLGCIGRIWEGHGILVNRIVTTGNEQDYKLLVANLFDNFQDITVEHLSYNHLNRYYSTDDFGGQGVIVIDDAFVTGENYFRILEYYSSKNVGMVLIYVIIKRASDKVANRLRNIKSFGNMIVEFKYLFDGRISVYSENNNPVERQLIDYEALSTRYAGFSICDFIKERIASLRYRSILEGNIVPGQDSGDATNYLRLRWKLEYAKKDIAIRKRLALLFDDSADNKEVLMLFSILVEEKYNFLLDRSFNETFFYAKFTRKVVDTCVKLLTNKKLSLSARDISNTVEILFTLSIERFAAFVENELIDVRDNDNIVNSIVCILSVAPQDYTVAGIKEKFVELIDQRPEVGERQKQFFHWLQRIWRNEEDELVGYDRTKAQYIRELLRERFHDLDYKVKDLNTYLSNNVNDAFSIFVSLIDQVGEAAKGFVNLFIGGSNNEEKSRINEKLEELDAAMRKSRGLIELIEKDGIADYAYLLQDYAENILRILRGEEGIIEVLKFSVRTKVKKELTTIFNPIIEAKGKKVFFDRADESCLVFCIPNDFRSIISNIRENILIHSEAENVRVDVVKVKRGNKYLIRIDIYDDGKKNDIISAGIGITKCRNLCRSYSGNFKNDRLPVDSERYREGYRTYATIELFDLSPDILNLPNDAE